MSPRSLFRLFFALGLLLIQVGGARAEGETGSKFLLVPQSAAAAALAGAYVAAQGDVSSLENNPAGPASLRDYQLLASHIVYPGSMYYTTASLAVRPYNRIGGFFRFRSLYLDDFQRDGIGQRVGGQNIPVTDRGYTAGLNYSIGSRASLGAAVELVDRTLYIFRDRTYAFSAGLQVYTEDRAHTIGLAVQNAGRGIRFRTDNEPLPTIYRLGGGHVLVNARARLLWELQKFSDKASAGASAGCEWKIADFFALRGGLGHDGSVYGSGGFGLNWKSYVLDYAVRPQSGIGLSHVMTLTLRWSGYEKDSDSWEALDRE